MYDNIIAATYISMCAVTHYTNLYGALACKWKVCGKNSDFFHKGVFY